MQTDPLLTSDEASRSCVMMSLREGLHIRRRRLSQSWGIYTYHYPCFVKDAPVSQDGFVWASEGPGLRIEFRTQRFERGAAILEL